MFFTSCAGSFLRCHLLHKHKEPKLLRFLFLFFSDLLAALSGVFLPSLPSFLSASEMTSQLNGKSPPRVLLRSKPVRSRSSCSLARSLSLCVSRTSGKPPSAGARDPRAGILSRASLGSYELSIGSRCCQLRERHS